MIHRTERLLSSVPWHPLRADTDKTFPMYHIEHRNRIRSFFFFFVLGTGNTVEFGSRSIKYPYPSHTPTYRNRIGLDLSFFVFRYISESHRTRF